MNILDIEQNRRAAERYGCFSFGLELPDKYLQRKEIVLKLLHDSENSGSKRQWEGTQLLRLVLTMDMTVSEIAAVRGTTEDDVRRLLSETRKNMRQIAEARYHLTPKDL